MSTVNGGISVRRVSGRMPHPTCVSRSFEENSWERVRESAPGCGPEFTSRTPSGWPRLGASCRPDESVSAAGGGRRRRPRCRPTVSPPSRAARNDRRHRAWLPAASPRCPTSPNPPDPARDPAVSPCSSSDTAGNELTLRVPGRPGAAPISFPGSPAEWGVRWVTWSRRAAGWPAEGRSVPRWSRRSPGAGPGRRLAGLYGPISIRRG